MASVGTLSLFFPIFLPATGAAALYFAHKALYVDWASYARDFLLGPGRTSRILLTLFILGNLKNMPFAWTVWPSPPISKLLFPPNLQSSY
jgi:hypothetical protein